MVVMVVAAAVIYSRLKQTPPLFYSATKFILNRGVMKRCEGNVVVDEC